MQPINPMLTCNLHVVGEGCGEISFKSGPLAYSSVVSYIILCVDILGPGIQFSFSRYRGNGNISIESIQFNYLPFS